MHLSAVPVALLLLGSGMTACKDASGCSDFNPKSEPIRDGESQDVSVEVVDGGWGIVDADDGYWSTDAVPAPDAGSGQVLEGVATKTPDGQLRVDFGEHGVVTFPGTYGCE